MNCLNSCAHGQGQAWELTRVNYIYKKICGWNENSSGQCDHEFGFSWVYPSVANKEAVTLIKIKHKVEVTCTVINIAQLLSLTKYDLVKMLSHRSL